MKLGSKESLIKAYIKLTIVLILTLILIIAAVLMGIKEFFITMIIVYLATWTLEWIINKIFMKYEIPDIIHNKRPCKHQWVEQQYEDVNWMYAPIKNFVCIKCWKKITPKEWKDNNYKDHNNTIKHIVEKNGRYYVKDYVN